jgi:putative component of toxin-antitoxin plasmid stabilization module
MQMQPREIRNYLTVDGKIIFDEWLDFLRDRRAKAKIRARIDRTSMDFTQPFPIHAFN